MHPCRVMSNVAYCPGQPLLSCVALQFLATALYQCIHMMHVVFCSILQHGINAFHYAGCFQHLITALYQCIHIDCVVCCSAAQPSAAAFCC